MGNVASTPESAAEAEQPNASAGRSSLPSALVIVGPSGVGKGTLINKLIDGDDRFGFSCSHTTRKPRAGEENGVHYHFTTKETFEKEIAEGQFLEYAYVHDNIYGTSINAVKAVATSGKCCILDIDVQGARQVRASDLRAIFVFIAPPSVEELERRLRGRGTESEEQITTRLKNARDELATLEEPGLYDHVIINNDLENGVKELRAIADRALAGEAGPPSLTQPGSAATSRGEPASATASLRAWLQPGETDSPNAFSPTSSIGGGGALSHGAAVPAGLLRWKGRVALVTGASSPIGRAVALSMIHAGLKVVAVARRKKELESLQEAVASLSLSSSTTATNNNNSTTNDTRMNIPATMTDFLPVVCDLTKEAEVVALPRIVEKRWPTSGGTIDVLVNAAGSGNSKSGTSLVQGTTSAWVNVVSVNVLGTALLTREVSQGILKRIEKGNTTGENISTTNGIAGHIISIGCTDDALDGSLVGGGMHGVSSRAVRDMMQSLNKELKQAVADAASKQQQQQSAAAMIQQTPCVRVSYIATDTVQQSGGGGGDDINKKSGGLDVDDVVAAVAWCLGAPAHVDVSTLELKSSSL